MNDDTIGAFSTAIANVLDEIGFDGFIVEDPILREETTGRDHQVSISVGLAGAISGFLLLQTGMDVAIAHAVRLSRLLGVVIDDPDSLGPMHKAALSEFVNQVSGRAAMYLSEMGIDADITPPTVITGERVSAGFGESLQFVDVGVRGPDGDLNVAVGFVTV